MMHVYVIIIQTVTGQKEKGACVVKEESLANATGCSQPTKSIPLALYHTTPYLEPPPLVSVRTG